MKKILLFFLLGLFLVGCTEEDPVLVRSDFVPALHEKNVDLRMAAVKREMNEDILCEVALNDADPVIRSIAIKRVYDIDTIEDAALNDEVPWVRAEAVKKIDDQEMLVDIVLDDPDLGVRTIAFENLRTVEAFERIVNESGETAFVLQAKNKLKLLGR